MSPRKRPRASVSDNVPPPPSPATSASVPTPVPTEADAASAVCDGGASLIVPSPANSAALSVAESTNPSRRDLSLKESKNKTRSWYGSWPRVPKSAASTQIAKETILGGTSKPEGSPDLERFDMRRPGEESCDGSADTGGRVVSRKASARTLTGAVNGAAPLKQREGRISGSRQTTADTGSTSGTKTPQNKALAASDRRVSTTPAATDRQVVPVAGAKPLAQGEPMAEPMDTAEDDTTRAAPSPPIGSQGWFSWIGRRQAADSKPPVPDEAKPDMTEQPKMEEETNGDGTLPPGLLDETVPPQDAAEVSSTTQPATSGGGVWTYLWPRGSRPAPTAAATEDARTAKDASKDSQDVSGDVVMEDVPPTPISVPVPATQASSASGTNTPINGSVLTTATASAGSTWAFWSRDSSKSTGKPSEADSATSGPGEIAVIGDRSEARPKPAAGIKVAELPSSKASSLKDVTVKDISSKESAKEAAKNAAAAAATAAAAAAVAAATTSKSSKRLRPKSMEIDDTVAAPDASSPDSQIPTKGGEAAAAATKQQQAASTAKGQKSNGKASASVSASASASSILLPTFRSTYRLKENPSILRQIAQLLLRTQQPPPNHVFLATEPPKIRKAVTIGVHGLFPAAYLRPMIGQPTGTSIRFANHGAEAVRRWADSHGCADCEIEKIALEGEGKIADRVDNLWKLLLNWIDHIRNADLVVLACHSQGVPVGFMLLAKLIDLGIITTARVGVCAMAGVSLGPFPDYKSGLGILMGSAVELWDFANPESEVSKRYEQALKTALGYGVRVAFVGSIDDQVVPLESAIFSPVRHPYVYRAVFVDGRNRAPDFIANLVGFACKLRNLGVSDHGLIRELSVPLAGSLYSGDGHSRLYDDPQVYDLGLAHTLETADVGNVPCEIAKHEGFASPNPYVLPWILRGLLEEDFVKTELQAETANLVRQFDDWKPVSKALKDVKYRLEAVRSKL